MNLVNYDAACVAIYAAESTDEVLSIMDMAEMQKAYARISQNVELEKSAFNIRIRAERRLGEMLNAQKNGGGLAKAGRPKKSVVPNDQFISKPKKKSVVPNDQLNSDTKIPTLKEMGITKDLSSRAQKLASIPAVEFEEHLDNHSVRIAAENAKTINKLEKSAKKHKPAPTPEPECDERQMLIDSLNTLIEDLYQQISDLKNQTAAGENQDYKARLDELTAENKKLQILNKSLTKARDTYLNENAALKRQCQAQQAKIKKLEK